MLTTTGNTITLTNPGTSAVSVANVSVMGAGLSASGISAGQTIAAGQSASLTVTFAPVSIGLVIGSVTVTTASTPPTVIAVIGTGVALTTSHSVSLFWSADPAGAVSYNVYRSSTSGSGYAKINSLPVLAPSYLDNTVSSGKTYYYVTTDVNTSSVESAYSNEVSANVP
jgi:fibronectin type 3 domain-containing protein